MRLLLSGKYKNSPEHWLSFRKTAEGLHSQAARACDYSVQPNGRARKRCRGRQTWDRARVWLFVCRPIRGRLIRGPTHKKLYSAVNGCVLHGIRTVSGGDCAPRCQEVEDDMDETGEADVRAGAVPSQYY